MKLEHDEALARLTAHDHGVLSTVHPSRGVDAVPCVYAVDASGFVGVPIDKVKPKTSPRLQRERNLELDRRATLLADHWDRHDWSRLWWVRAELTWEASSSLERRLASSLRERYEQYRDADFHRVLVFRIVGLTGWSGDGGG